MMQRRNLLTVIAAGAVASPVFAAENKGALAPAEEPPKRDKKILFVITSHSDLGKTGKKTGYWLSEVTHPWKILKDVGYEIDFVSPKGGACAFEGDDPSDPVNKEFSQDMVYQKKINFTLKPSDIKPDEYAAIYYAGGHGAMWDFPDNKELAAIASKIYTNGGVVASVCHGAAGLINIKLPNGTYLINDKKINSFTDSEEEAVNLKNVVPFSLETKLKAQHAHFEKSDNFQTHCVVNDRVITGQNPMSAAAVGSAIKNALAS